MINLPIEKGVEIPAVRVGRPESHWPALEVGDSIFISAFPDELKKVRAKVAVGYRKQRQAGQKFTSRQVEGGLRVWRIA